MQVCANCGKTFVVDGKISRGATCVHCGAYLHSCTNCNFFSPGSHNDCREPQADFVGDKRSSNFCEYFVFKVKPTRPTTAFVKHDGKQKAKDAFNKLFGD
jgi:hypothetical protein